MDRNELLLSVLLVVCSVELVSCYSALGHLQNSYAQFRYDYKYFEEVEGWFKLHRIPRTFKEAQHRCVLEGADLASPTSQDMVLAMAHALNHPPPWNGVYIGVRATFAPGEYQYNGIPLDKMPLEWSPNGPSATLGRDCIVFHDNSSISNEDCSRELPFLCFKKKTEQFALNSCGTIDNDYNYDKRTGSCYKFHGKGENWKTAVMTCAAEGAYLAVVNSATEIMVLQSIIKNCRTDSIKFECKDTIFLGFADLYKTREWTTVLGKPLVETYEAWDKDEPNNANGGEYCGNLNKGRMNDAQCTSILQFICEKNPKSLLSDAVTQE